MRGLGSTVLLCFAILCFFGLVALTDYSWTSWDAYVRVRIWEFGTIIIVMAVVCVVGAVMSLYDWCLSWWYSQKDRSRK